MRIKELTCVVLAMLMLVLIFSTGARAEQTETLVPVYDNGKLTRYEVYHPPVADDSTNQPSGLVTITLGIQPTNSTVTGTIDTTYDYQTTWTQVLQTGYGLFLPLFANGWLVVTDDNEIMAKYDWWKLKALQGDKFQPAFGPITDFVERIGAHASINYFDESQAKVDWNYTIGVAGITNYDFDYLKVKAIAGVRTTKISEITNPEPSATK